MANKGRLGFAGLLGGDELTDGERALDELPT
jgi:hypothetical protein